MPSRLDQTQGTAGAETVEDDSPQPQEQVQPLWSDTVDIPQDQLTIPFLTLGQAMSKAVRDENNPAKEGDWLLQGYEPVKAVVLVPLRFGISRNLSEEGEEGGLETICYSPTGHEHGIALKPEGPGIPCDDCPLREWQPTDRTDARGRKINNPPPCKESYDFLAYSETHGTFVRVGFRSTGLRSGRLLATLGKTRGLGTFAVTLGSVGQQGKRGMFRVPTVTIMGNEQAGPALETAAAMLALSAGSADAA